MWFTLTNQNNTFSFVIICKRNEKMTKQCVVFELGKLLLTFATSTLLQLIYHIPSDCCQSNKRFSVCSTECAAINNLFDLQRTYFTYLCQTPTLFLHFFLFFNNLKAVLQNRAAIFSEWPVSSHTLI